jgi:hypothetical protein
VTPLGPPVNRGKRSPSPLTGRVGEGATKVASPETFRNRRLRYLWVVNDADQNNKCGRGQAEFHEGRSACSRIPKL